MDQTTKPSTFPHLPCLPPPVPFTMSKTSADVLNDTLAPPTTQSAKRSWVWAHFEADADANKAICQVVTNQKTSRACGRFLNLDNYGSTKSLNEHLTKVYNLSDPKKKDKNNASNQKYFHKRTLEKVSL